MSDWFTTLDGLLAACWSRLDEGTRDSDAPAHLPVLSTVDADHAAQARVVVLRRANAATAEIDIHTDSLSAKVSELGANPAAALTLWHPEALLQIRLRMQMSVLTGDALAPLWEGLSEGARLNYGGMPPPGRPIPTAQNHDPGAVFDRFALLRGRVMQIDLVHLDPRRHRRAFYDRSDDFSGRWLAP